MESCGLEIIRGHWFARCGDRRMLINTGSPISLGDSRPVIIDGVKHALTPDLAGVTAEALASPRSIGVPFSAVLGNDILANFDIVFDPSIGRVTFSRDEVRLGAWDIEIALTGRDEPVLIVEVRGQQHRMHLGIGEERSSFQSVALFSEPLIEIAREFHPAIGEFPVLLHRLPVGIGGNSFAIKCCRLPEKLATDLLSEGVDGILGCEIMRNRVSGYFPRRNKLVLGPARQAAPRQIN